MTVTEAIKARRSVRGFLAQPVEQALLVEIATKAARAPTGGNLQPWHIDILTGAPLEALKGAIAAKLWRRESETPAYDIYPRELPTLYADRRFAVGEALYATLGIPREDKAARRLWFARNFAFFGAPAALFCTVDRHMGPPQWADLGMYLHNVMLLAVEAGLATCPQECWAMFPETVTHALGTPPERMLFCGMAIGHEDPDEPANALRTERASTTEWLTLHG